MTLSIPVSCDSGIASAVPSARAEHPLGALCACILGSSVAFIDGSAVNVSLPALQTGLSASYATVSWAINAYLLPLGALILLGGAVGDRFGRRRLFLTGLTLFTIASLGCAVAPDFSWFLFGRSLQGFGAALLLPNSLAILGSSFEGEAQGRAIGTWAAVGAFAGAVGGVLGGWVVDAVGWRSIFLINMPIAAAAGYFADRYVEESRGDDGPLDWLGAMIVTLGLLGITWALTTSSGDRGSGSSLAIGILGIVLLALFVRVEHRRRGYALMPLTLFATASFAGLSLVTFFLYGSLGGMLLLLPSLLIHVAHYSATTAGAAILPLPVVIALGSRAMGRVTGRYGGRWPLAIGATFVACGLALFLRVDDSIDYWRDIFPATLLVAIGMGISSAPLTSSVMTSVDRDHVGAASGFNSAMARIAGLIASALLGYVWASQESTETFLAGIHAAALVGTVSALVAAASALLLVRTPKSAEASISSASARGHE